MLELDPLIAYIGGILIAYIVGILIGFVFGYLLGKLRLKDEEVEEV